MSDKYWDKYYNLEVRKGVDTLVLNKGRGSDWCIIHMSIHDKKSAEITLRHKEHATALHHMLGEMLGKV